MILIESIREADDGIAQLFEELYDPALLIDIEQGLIVGANAAASRFLGYSAEELVRMSPADIHPHEIPRLDAFLLSVRRHGRWMANTLSCRAKGGCLLPAQARATQVRIRGRPYVMAVVRDRREEELAELGRSVRKLTHDLRNTMVASRLMSNRLRRHDNPRVRQSAEIITRSIDRAVGICQRALELGSADENQPRRVSFPLSDMVGELEAAIGPGETVTATLEAPSADSVSVHADFDQVYRILMNLVRNAIAAGSERIRIRGSTESGSAEIRIEDDGPGLPEPLREAPFAEKATSQGEASGLGLAIAWELARINAGDLELLETDASGTVFLLRLPAAQDVPDASATATAT